MSQYEYIRGGERCLYFFEKSVWNKNHARQNQSWSTILISGSASTGLICEVIESGIGAIPYTGIIRLWPGSKSIYKDYIRWIVSSDQFDTQISIYQAGSTIKHFGPEHLKKMEVTLPPLPEQQAIAAFLDRETGRIDALIAKKQRLLELLAEQRTALISRAVTRGLDPKVKLKPSGVEWLGDVPEHWGVKKLKFIGTSLIGLTYSPNELVDEDYEGEKHLVLRSTNIQDGKISLHENVYVTTRVSKELKVRKLDILICARNGSRHLVGKNALIHETDDNMTFGAFTTVFRSKINPFLFYYFSSNQFQYQSTGFLTTTINQLTNGNLNSIIASIPPLPEQQAIAAFLDRETAKIDTLSTKVSAVIERLKEYRTALISSAVTGKIDVRGSV